MSGAIKPATLDEVVARCPVQAPSVHFNGAVCRCVLRDDHTGGRCKLIDGRDLTAEVYTPRMRYVLMGLTPPERLAEAGLS